MARKKPETETTAPALTVERLEMALEDAIRERDEARGTLTSTKEALAQAILERDAVAGGSVRAALEAQRTVKQGHEEAHAKHEEAHAKHTADKDRIRKLLEDLVQSWNGIPWASSKVGEIIASL